MPDLSTLAPVVQIQVPVHWAASPVLRWYFNPHDGLADRDKFLWNGEQNDFHFQFDIQNQ